MTLGSRFGIYSDRNRNDCHLLLSLLLRAPWLISDVTKLPNVVVESSSLHTYIPLHITVVLIQSKCQPVTIAGNARR